MNVCLFQFPYIHRCSQGLVKGAILCFRNPYFYFRHGESTSTASQKSKDLNKVLHLLQDLGWDPEPFMNYYELLLHDPVKPNPSKNVKMSYMSYVTSFPFT